MNTETQIDQMANEGLMLYAPFNFEVPEDLGTIQEVPQEPPVQDSANGDEVDMEQAMKLLETIQKKLDELKAAEAKVAVKGTKKNQRPGKPTAGRKYILLSNKLAAWGKVPQQQLDLAQILVSGMEVGKEYSEAEVFDMLVEGAGDHKSLYGAVQDVTYLFRYYRGLKNDGKHAGFIPRNFLRQIG